MRSSGKQGTPGTSTSSFSPHGINCRRPPTNGVPMSLPLAAISLSAMPVMIIVLCCMAIAYRYYSAFLAAKVAVLDDSRVTPAVRMNDGQNYHPTSKWVLFGHHFAAISGAGPLVGPVL